MKIILISLLFIFVQACSEEETPLEKFLKSETPSFYAEVTGEVAVVELGKEIRLVQGENVSIVSTHQLGTPGVSMKYYTAWEYFSEGGRSSTDAEGRIKNGKVEVLKYKCVPNGKNPEGIELFYPGRKGSF